MEVKGLSLSEVAQRINRGESNRYTIRPARTYWQIILANVFSLYNMILLLSVIFLLVLQGPNNTLVPGVIVLVNMLLGLIQEVRAKRALDKLATLSVRTVAVHREGHSTMISIDQIVRDDVIELHPGDPVVVDGPVIFSDSLEIDESLLTGESENVLKRSGDELLSGSFCVAGIGLMRADKIGKESYVNGLAKTAKTYKNVRTPLERRLDAIFQLLILIMVILGPLTIVAGFVHKTLLPESVENMVNLVSSLVPQGLIVSVTVSFSYGALNIARLQALIQRLNAIESMGHLTVLCTDKTGTLTRNVLSLREIIPIGDESLNTIQIKLSLFVKNISWMNKTIAAIAASLDTSSQQLAKIGEVPFTSERKWSALAFSSGETLLLGAPELLLADPQLQEKVTHLSKQGFRVLVFATSPLTLDLQGGSLPASRKCIAIIVLQDEIRSDIRKTLQAFAEQSIAVKVISGDSPQTVEAVARQAGFDGSGVLTGMQFEQLDELAFDTAVRETNLFARVGPEMKSKIIESLTRQGSYVAMIGDGVNDVPALKQAKVAIAMNDGAQIAKDVSDIILLNNAFSTLPKTIAEGQEITQRVYAVAKIFFVKVVYLTLLFLLVGFAGLPFPASLRQTTWLGLMTVAIPTVLIAFKVLRPATIKNVSKDVLQYSLLGGIIGGVAMTLAALIVLVLFGRELALSRTIVTIFASLYGTLIFWEVFGITPFSPRSYVRKPIAALVGGILAVVSTIIPLYLIPTALGLVPLGLVDWLFILLLLGATYVAFWYVTHRFSFSAVLNKLNY